MSSPPQVDSNPEVASGTALLAVPAKDLRVGMYVHLDCSWFVHPFAHQQFKLTSNEQIATLASLNLRVLVDPARSDTPLATTTSPEVGQPIAESSTPPTEPVADASMAPPSTPDTSTAPSKPQTIETFVTGLREANQLYREATAQFQQAVHELAEGSESGVASAKTVINQLAPLVFDEAITGALAGLLDIRQMDEADLLHALNVSVLSMMVGQQLELPVEDIKVLGIGALLHDIGERKIPAEVLARRGTFTPADQEIYARHPEFGLEVLDAIPAFPAEALKLIQLHHERLDGSGYPRGLTGEYLSLFTKIVMVVETYDELIHPRDPQRSLTPSEALAYLFRHTQRSLPREIVTALIQSLSVYPPGSIVELVNGAYGLVLNVNRQDRLKPLILLYTPGESGADPVVVNLMTDPTRAIAQRAAKQRLSPRILNYLDLKRWLPHFLN